MGAAKSQVWAVYLSCQVRLMVIITTNTINWLQTLPLFTSGLENEVIWVAIGIRLDFPICEPHYWYWYDG